MKILIYSREPLKTKVVSILTQHGIEMIDISHTTDFQAALGRCEKPHLALIDRNAENAVSANECIKKLWDIPAVLIMGAEKEEWRGLEQFVADGYVQDTFKNDELVVRLSAIHRRVTASGNKVIS